MGNSTFCWLGIYGMTPDPMSLTLTPDTPLLQCCRGRRDPRASESQRGGASPPVSGRPPLRADQIQVRQTPPFLRLPQRLDQIQVRQTPPFLTTSAQGRSDTGATNASPPQTSAKVRSDTGATNASLPHDLRSGQQMQVWQSLSFPGPRLSHIYPVYFPYTSTGVHQTATFAQI